LLLLINSSRVFAKELQIKPQQEKPLLTWLPLLSSNLKRLQVNKYCPQNQFHDIQVRTENDKLFININKLDWDLNCLSSSSSNIQLASPSGSEQKQTAINSHIDQITTALATFPESEIRINSIYIQSENLNKTLALTMTIRKNAQFIVVDLANEVGRFKLKMNLISKNISADLDVNLIKISPYVDMPSVYKKLIKGNLKVDYLGNLKQWQEGAYTLNAVANMTGVAESIALKSSGNINLLSKQLALDTMTLDLNKINYRIAENKNWQSDYIKIRLTEKKLITLLPQLNFKKMPISLRIGSSVLEIKDEKVNRQKLPAVSVILNPKMIKNEVSGDWKLSSLNQSVEGDVKYSKRHVKVKVKPGQLSAATLFAALSDYYPRFKYWSVNSGEIDYQAEAEYDLTTKSGSLNSRLSAKNIAGKKEDLVFDGLNFSSKLDYQLNHNELLIAQDIQQIKLDSLYIGIPINNLQLDAKFNAGLPIIDHFRADLLGGKVSLNELKLQAPSSSVLEVSALSLNEIVAHSAYPEINSQASIDGQLPLQLTSKGVSIVNGTLYARPPGGFIKVPKNQVSKAITESNPAFSFTLGLLADFQFDRLQGMIDYNPDGNLDLAVEIKGLSPDVSGKQAVEFNYTHQENILELLESLRFIRAPANIIN
jgi:hypothetical protein